MRTLTGQARVEQRGRGGRVKATVLLWAARQEQLRLDAMTQFGPALTLTFDGNELLVSDLRKKEFLRGRSCFDQLGRRFGVPLPPRAVVSSLFGSVPFRIARGELKACTTSSYEVKQEQDGGSVTMRWNVREQDVNAPPSDQQLYLQKVIVRSSRGKLVRELTYDDYRSVWLPSAGGAPQAVPMPFQIRYRAPSEKVDTWLRFKDMTLNAEPPQDAFRQTPRPGLHERKLTCQSS